MSHIKLDSFSVKLSMLCNTIFSAVDESFKQVSAPYRNNNCKYEMLNGLVFEFVANAKKELPDTFQYVLENSLAYVSLDSFKASLDDVYSDVSNVNDVEYLSWCALSEELLSIGDNRRLFGEHMHEALKASAVADECCFRCGASRLERCMC